MKRVVQCPACSAKLMVLDFGKPIQQKCPKCGEKFTVDPEGAQKSQPAPEAAPAPAPTPAPAATAPAEMKPAAKEITLKEPVTSAPKPAAPDPKPTPAPAPEVTAEAKPAAKEITLKKPVAPAPKPAAPDPKPTPAPAPEIDFSDMPRGLPFSQLIMILALLGLIIGLLIIHSRKTDSQYNNLINHLQHIETKLK